MSDLVQRLRELAPNFKSYQEGRTRTVLEAANRILHLERENEELRGACLSEAMQATPLTPHGQAIAAGDGTLHGAIDYWQEQAFTMAAGQCCVKSGGLMADDHGHQYCDMERQRDELKAKLAAKPDVAGLVKRLREGDHGFDRNGSHSEDRYVCLCEHLANEAADALLSLSAQLQEKEAECIKVRGLCDAIAADLTDCKAECEGLKAERDKLLVMASRMADCINRCQDDDDCSDLVAAHDFRQEYPR